MRDEKRPGRQMTFLFTTASDHCYTVGTTIQEAYHRATELMGEKPTAYKFVYFIHPRRKDAR